MGSYYYLLLETNRNLCVYIEDDKRTYISNKESSLRLNENPYGASLDIGVPWPATKIGKLYSIYDLHIKESLVA